MDDAHRYVDALHAVQSGIQAEMEFDSGETTPKHLRVGVNAAHCDHAALVRLLMNKGLFTEDEYRKELADEMEREKRRYEDRLSRHYNGKQITLG